MVTLPKIIKDPSANLDYALDWSQWLQDGEVISSTSWTTPDGITKGAVSFTTTHSMVWLSGGTAGTDYTVVCTITTSQSRTDQRSILIQCRDR